MQKGRQRRNGESFYLSHLWPSKLEFLLIPYKHISFPYLCHSFLVFVANSITFEYRYIRTIECRMINDFGSCLTSPHFRSFAEFLSLLIKSLFNFLFFFCSRFYLTSTLFHIQFVGCCLFKR